MSQPAARAKFSRGHLPSPRLLPAGFRVIPLGTSLRTRLRRLYLRWSTRRTPPPTATSLTLLERSTSLLDRVSFPVVDRVASCMSFLEVEELVGGSLAPAGPDKLDLEAAEQLIQLSGGDSANDGGESESRDADSVRCCRAAEGGEVKDTEAAVESRRRSAGRFLEAGKDVDESGEPGSKTAGVFEFPSEVGTEETNKEVAVESRRRSGARLSTGTGVMDGADVDVGIEMRKTPKLRLLAGIYRELDKKKRALVYEDGENSRRKKRWGRLGLQLIAMEGSKEIRRDLVREVAPAGV